MGLGGGAPTRRQRLTMMCVGCCFLLCGRSIKAAKEKRLDAKKKDSKKKAERRRKDWD